VKCDVTYEELAAYAAGETGPTRQAEIAEHISQCERCRRRLAALKAADAALAGVRAERPPPAVVLAARRALAEQTRPQPPAEIMTIEEAAEFLRLSSEQIAEVAESLPAFELAGQVRIRRTRLIEWIQQRESDYCRTVTASWAARAAVADAGEGAW
jgi:anti-sigma factor RsiW